MKLDVPLNGQLVALAGVDLNFLGVYRVGLLTSGAWGNGKCPLTTWNRKH